MSAITSWLLDNVVSHDTLLFIAFIPVLATLVAFARYFLGFKTYGLYGPMILSVSYYITGLKYGLIMTIIVVATTILTYYFVSQIRMHYLARISINYSVLTISIILTLILLSFIPGLEKEFTTQQMNPIAVFSIAAISDFFIKQYSSTNLNSAIRRLSETTIVAAIGWIIIATPQFSEFIVNNIWILPIFIPLNYLIGQYRGMRVQEILRFKQVIENVERDIP